MSDNGLCKLCQDNPAINLDLKLESASKKLLQTLMKSYQIDPSILEERSSICQQCFNVVLQMSQTLEKWSKAQEMLKASPLDIDDSNIFHIKLEPDSNAQFSEIQADPQQAENALFIKEEEPETDDLEFMGSDVELVEEVSSDPSDDEVASSEDSDEEMSAEGADTDWRSSLENFFCVCLGPDGLALTILFKDKTKEKNIRMLCTCCNKLFTTLSDIHKHASVTRAHPEYWCGVCDAIYPSIFELKIHEKIKKHPRPKTRAMVMRCLKCGARSNQLSDAIKHDNDFHYKSTLVCHMCRISCENRESLQKHLLEHQTYMCRYPNCISRFQIWSNYTKHLVQHKNQRSLCPVDGCSFIMEPGNHDNHLKTHLPSYGRYRVGQNSSIKK
ncbi:PR domain zinc finger protein 5-like [Drosophila serrata]|uniref:PR domain zinc finger protein 5-like n=1 Tax=Drosophila serrata TaxID=7274 RepID=UPI000A1D088D|nr:PR domain zinc finger protein 5-like [Drosophila serrata]